MLEVIVLISNEVSQPAVIPVFLLTEVTTSFPGGFLSFSYSNSATEWGRQPVRNVQQDQEMEDAEETDACEEAEETPEVHKQSKTDTFSERAGRYLDVSFTDLIRNSGKFPDNLWFW